MAQITNPAYYGGQQWSSHSTCSAKHDVCSTPWWFLIGVVLAATAGNKKRKARRKAAAK